VGVHARARACVHARPRVCACESARVHTHTHNDGSLSMIVCCYLSMNIKAFLLVFVGMVPGVVSESCVGD
jgi:hypothetical protein